MSAPEQTGGRMDAAQFAGASDPFAFGHAEPST